MIPQVIPTPYSENDIAGLANSITPYDQSMEGGINLYQETIPTGEVQIYKQLNVYRKTLTLLNVGSVTLSMVILNPQNVEVLIPLPVGGGYTFNTIKRGSVDQCINGFTLKQDLITCEYQGIIKIKNTNVGSGTLLIVEAI